MAADTTSQPQAEWDEARLQSSLEQLQNMHVQLLDLRRAIPSVVEQLTLQHATPEDLFSAYSESATFMGKKIQGFLNTYSSPEYGLLVEKAQESKDGDKEGIRPWLISDHPDWTEIKKEDVEIEMRTVASVQGQEGKGMSQDVGATLKRFSEQHEDVRIKYSETGKVDRFTLTLKNPSVCKQFEVNIENSSIKVSCPGSGPFLRAVERCVVSRSKPEDLSLLLNMLASYTGPPTARCAKCDQLLDRKALRPAARRQQSKLAGGQAGTLWKALHEHCI